MYIYQTIHIWNPYVALLWSVSGCSETALQAPPCGGSAISKGSFKNPSPRSIIVEELAATEMLAGHCRLSLILGMPPGARNPRAASQAVVLSSSLAVVCPQPLFVIPFSFGTLMPCNAVDHV